MLIQGDIKVFLEKSTGRALKPLPNNVEFKNFCSPVSRQGELNSSAAIAMVGLVEYIEIRFFNKHIKASSLFLYKVARNLVHLTGNVNVLPRTVVGSLVLFGVPPDEYWPYTEKLGAEPDGFDREPSAFCYAFAQNYKAKGYMRLDSPTTNPEDLLEKIKIAVANEIPSIISFDIYDSIYQDLDGGTIPYPQKDEKLRYS